MTKKRTEDPKISEVELRKIAMQFALGNKPPSYISGSVTGGLGNIPFNYDLISETKKIYNYLKTGK